jgi:hypothetical protein
MIPGRPILLIRKLLRADICASAGSRAPADVLVFDGDPSNGSLITWKRVYMPNAKQCEGTWFSWTPTSGQHDLVAAILPNSATSILPNDATLESPPALTQASLAVNVP